MSRAHKLNEKGIGLVEVIAALGVSVVVLTSLVSLALFTVRSSLQSKLLLEGTKLASRELELVRAYRDGSDEWENGSDGFLDEVMPCTNAANACHMVYSPGLSVDQSGAATEGSGAETITRQFTATRQDGTALQSGDEVVRIAVQVSWNIGNETKYARLYTDLTNWANK
jgi:Tfp pilus assembly protein PilV